MKRSRFLLTQFAFALAIVGYVAWCWSGFVLEGRRAWDENVPAEARALIEDRLGVDGGIAFKAPIAMRALTNPYKKPRFYVFVDRMNADWIEVTTVVEAGTKDTRGDGYGLFLIDGEWVWSDAEPEAPADRALAAVGR